MKKIFSISFLLLTFLLLSGCASMSTNKLPSGSNVAILSALDNKVTYDSLGTTSFQNNHFQQNAPQLNMDSSLISPIQTTLANTNGYHVTVLHIPSDNPLNNIYADSGPLTDAQKNYLLAQVHGKNIQRVILLSKDRPNLDNMPSDDAIGYGYVQRKLFGLTNTIMFGAVSITVIDLSDLKVHAIRATYDIANSSDRFFNPNPSYVDEQSIINLKEWLSTTFSPQLTSLIAGMGA